MKTSRNGLSVVLGLALAGAAGPACKSSSKSDGASDGGGTGGSGGGGGGAADGGGGDAGGSDVSNRPLGPINRMPDLTKMVAIPASSFQMGHPDETPAPYGQAWKENEMPAHMVTLGGFHIDRDEVTVADYADFLTAAGGSLHWHPLMPITHAGPKFTPAAGLAKRPIGYVSWYDAATYCAWTGKRLPTEAEWERAGRGPMNTTYPWGEAGASCALTVGFTRAAFCETAPQDVGSRSPKGDTPEGLHDMAGNVAEWVADFYDRYPLDAVSDPPGPASGKYRVVRGGGFREAFSEQRATARWGTRPENKSEGVGFRCALKP